MKGGIIKIIESKSKAFFTLCFCFLLGVGFASFLEFKLQFYYFYFIFFVIIIFFILFWKNVFVRFLLMFILFFILGLMRYSIAFSNIIENGEIIHNLNKTVDIIGFVANEPDIRPDGVRYIFKIDDLRLKNKEILKGKIYFKSGLYPRYDYGDELIIKCQLRRPEEIDGFRYDMYLAKLGVFAVCDNPQINKISDGKGNFIFKIVLFLKNKFAEKIIQLWPEPQASFMAGLLYGYRGGLGDLNNAFNRAGITHIVAVSGYNVSIIATILIVILTFFFIPRKKAFWLVVFGIFIFVVFSGASPSVVRAGIMGIIVLGAKYIGRISRPANILILAGVIMTIENPFVLFWDAGFQLSFLSTFGILYLSPILGKYFKFLDNITILKETILTTLSAILATFPLILFQFGRLSIVAPLVNVLILWIIPYLMFFGFLSVIASFIFLPIGQVIAWIAGLGLNYVIILVEWFGDKQWSAIDISLPWFGMILFYLIIIVLCVKQKFYTQKKAII